MNSDTLSILYFERADNVSALSNFLCGINDMDIFIHNRDIGLEKYIKMGLTNLWVDKDNNEEVVAFFALSKSSLRINSDDRMHLSHCGLLVNESIIQERNSFPSIEIDYLAVKSNKRGYGIGSLMIDAIVNRISSDTLSATMFICVDALDTLEYSAVNFYKKCGFVESEAGHINNLNQLREGIQVSTVKMYKPIFGSILSSDLES